MVVFSWEGYLGEGCWGGGVIMGAFFHVVENLTW